MALTDKTPFLSDSDPLYLIGEYTRLFVPQWQNISLENGFASQGSGFTPRIATIGPWVTIQGIIKATSGDIPRGNVQVASLSAEHRPTSQIYMSTATSDPERSGRLIFKNDGVMMVSVGSNIGYCSITCAFAR